MHPGSDVPTPRARGSGSPCSRRCSSCTAARPRPIPTSSTPTCRWWCRRLKLSRRRDPGCFRGERLAALDPVVPQPQPDSRRQRSHPRADLPVGTAVLAAPHAGAYGSAAVFPAGRGDLRRRHGVAGPAVQSPGNRRTAWWGAMLAGCGTATWSVSGTALWPHGPDQLLIVLSMLALAAGRPGTRRAGLRRGAADPPFRRHSGGRPGRRRVSATAQPEPRTRSRHGGCGRARRIPALRLTLLDGPRSRGRRRNDRGRGYRHPRLRVQPDVPGMVGMARVRREGRGRPRRPEPWRPGPLLLPAGAGSWAAEGVARRAHLGPVQCPRSLAVPAGRAEGRDLHRWNRLLELPLPA